MRFTGFILAALGLSLLWSCHSDDDPVVEEQELEYLTDSTFIYTRSAEDLRNLLQLGGLDVPTDQIVYDVDIYRVDYTTTYKNEEITASGMVFVPKTEDEISLLSFQHGTIAANSEAPSQLPVTSSQIILLQAVASTGLLTIAPDYVGFGASNELMHPYFVEEVTATAVIDNLLAARELAATKALNVSERLYLAGYSQGGYATMATHKYLEEHEFSEFDLIASFPSSGGYDIVGMQRYFFAQEVYHQPFFLAYVAEAYRVSFDWENDLSAYFNEPYASAIPGLFDGTLNGNQINDQLNDTLAVLVNSRYLSDSETDPAYDEIIGQYEANSLLDWTPQIPMHMFHGDADFTVPYENSVATYERLIANGASESVVTFTALPDKTHGSGVVPYLELFVNLLISTESQFD